MENQCDSTWCSRGSAQKNNLYRKRLKRVEFIKGFIGVENPTTIPAVWI